MHVGEDIPVGTLSPICSSDIFTDFPFLSWTLAVEGKQPPPPPDGADVVGVGVVVFGDPTQKW